jgi:acetate kinase
VSDRAACRVLVVNAGSSSLKLRVLDRGDLVAAQDLPPPDNGDSDGDSDGDALRAFLAAERVDAVGHRVVHGGTAFTEPVRLDEGVVARLRELTALAPLHQPKSLAGIAAVAGALPDVPAVACFDTAFHAGLPAAAATYALPEEWRTRWGIRRFGFHGLSHAFAARRGPELLGLDPARTRTVVCHLGAGASLCAVAGGHSVDTTMGFTPLEGLVMATRSGSVDPGLLLWLQEQTDMPPRELADALEHSSGLLALGGSADMQVLLHRAAAGDGPATLALDVYVHRLAAGVAAMTAALGGLDLLVFTGGVGENAAPVRSRTAERVAFLGVELDAERNSAARGDTDIGARGAGVRTAVVTAREDLEIARGVATALGQGR